MGNFFGKGSSKYSCDTDIVVKVKTGDKKGAGTDANVQISFVNEKGDVSAPHSLDVLWRNDFEAGSLDDFEIKNMADFGHIVAIDIWRDTAGLLDDWYVEWVAVDQLKHEVNSVFPIHRWIPANKKLRIKEFDVFLPQDESNCEQRQNELDNKKKVYERAIKIDGWLPQVKDLPSDEKFSNDYMWDILSLKAELVLHMKFKGALSGKWKNFDEIFSIYNATLEKPLGSETWKDDEAFGLQRLNHCNPNQIRRCDKIPDHIAVTEEMLQPLLEGYKIEDAIKDEKLYYIDYKILQELPCANNRIVAAPIALFFVNKEGKLLPVAIQLFQEPSENNPVFLPTDDQYTWLLAKMWFNNADASFHQTCTHLGYTHLIMEPIAVATHRSLSPSHPMFRLLAPHFLYLLAINSRGLSFLISPGGWVDKCMTIGCSGMFNLVVRQLGNWRMDTHGTLPNDLKERGVDGKVLQNYYYRDDALLMYNAIKNYVSEVAISFYNTPDKVINDQELQEWAHTLSAPPSEGGTGVPGVPGGGKFQSVEEVAQVITSIIFMGSVAHAACNFSQYDDYGFPPNYPAFLQGMPITDKKPRTENDINQTLPPKDVTLDTLLITRLLSMQGTRPLGDFEVKYLFDPASEKALQNFRKELNEVATIIDERNKTRPVPYKYLHPDRVPNSITI
ncbi:polyunsaturated fatty acid 5-lipoxygenase-like [Apostichopus japonicus]|uniref:polyunsaturated fatty acid 5-lipoxygenase-like n=1 Tax=Stichopus japonicus TaxID=307972 RepID=UPI003AB29BF3